MNEIINNTIKDAMRRRHRFPRRICFCEDGVRLVYAAEFREQLRIESWTAVKNDAQWDAVALMEASPALLDSLIEERAKNDELSAQLAAQKQLAEERAQRATKLEFSQRWIPVSERWPDSTNETVIVALRDGGTLMMSCVYEGMPYPVTHWMPMPAAPASGESEARNG